MCVCVCERERERGAKWKIRVKIRVWPFICPGSDKNLYCMTFIVTKETIGF